MGKYSCSVIVLQIKSHDFKIFSNNKNSKVSKTIAEVHAVLRQPHGGYEGFFRPNK